MVPGRLAGGGRLQKRRTVKQYRALDLAMFALMLTVAETLAVTAARRWFPNEPYTVSVTPAITAIVMMRWGPWAGLHAALGGIVFCLTSGAGIKHYFIYGLGNLLSLAALMYVRFATPEGIRESVWKSLALALMVALLMQLGRALIAVVLGSPPMAALGFFTTDVVTLLFTLVLIWIARRLDGIFEEQNHYLLRLRQQENEERGGY